MSQFDLFKVSDAVFSPCRTWRYVLTRKWSEGPTLNALMLNPSTADEALNDNTVERVERRARTSGYGQLVVTNLFAFRATDPQDMLAASDPVGPENDRYILEVAQTADMVLCAWGAHGNHLDRSSFVVSMLRRVGASLHYLVLTSAGEPGHPLYLPYSLQPTPWAPEETHPQ